jgi:hypothetical protein
MLHFFVPLFLSNSPTSILNTVFVNFHLLLWLSFCLSSFCGFPLSYNWSFSNHRLLREQTAKQAKLSDLCPRDSDTMYPM